MVDGNNGPEIEEDRVYNVGIFPEQKDTGIALAKKMATSIERVLDLGNVGAVVTGQFDGSSRDELRHHAAIKYVEVDEAAKVQRSNYHYTSSNQEDSPDEGND